MWRKMNRNQRKYGRVARRNDSAGKIKLVPNRNGADLEEVFPPRGRRGRGYDDERSGTNRCCFVSPESKDFGQSTDNTTFVTPSEQYKKVLLDQYGFDPVMPETITQLKELKKVLCSGSAKVENSSQYANNDYTGLCVPYFETLDESTWQNVDNADDIEKFLTHREKPVPETLKSVRLPRSVRIAEAPRVRIIAERFSRLKKDNIELRRLDEKVVCVEYDIYDDSSTGDLSRPVQRMRAFFSVKPLQDVNEAAQIRELPSAIKNKFSIADGDLHRLTDKEIEIIDGKIEENRPYLEDLKRILKRKQIVDAKKNKSSLDLLSLYEMAKKQRPILDGDFSNANLLSNAELQEMKDLILARSAPSGQGISRKRLKYEECSVISESVVAVLLRDDKFTS